MIEPRGWQQEALRTYKGRAGKSFLLEATPGAGKTIFSALAAKSDLTDDQISFAIVVVPTTAVKGDEEAGFLGDWHKCNIEIKTSLREYNALPQDYSGAVITYQQLPNMVMTFQTWQSHGAKLLFVFDEIHHASEYNVWGSAVEACGAIASRILCMTGTPFRSDNQRISFVRYNDQGIARPDYRYTYTDAVQDRVCRQAFFSHDDGIAEYVYNEKDESVRISESKEENNRHVVKTIFQKNSEFLRCLVEKADLKLDEYRNFDANAGGIIVCRPGIDDNDDRHLRAVAKVVKQVTGVMPEVITHEDKDANLKIAKFRQSRDRWICSVRKISEGVDIKRLRVMVMASKPGTELLFRQLVGRVIRHEDRSQPEDATIYFAKFPQLVKWAKSIQDEAEAGLKKREKREATENDDNQAATFHALGATHEDAGGVSFVGEEFTWQQIAYAEAIKQKAIGCESVPVWQVASLQKAMNIQPEYFERPDPPLDSQKKKKRNDVNRLVRALAIAIDPNDPPFKNVWTSIRKKFGIKDIDDLHDNYPLQRMVEVHNWLKQQLGPQSS
jgi:superfamily II DNA or RNA helicase